MTPGHTASNSILFGEDGSILSGYNNESTEFGFRTMAVGPGGVEATNVKEGLIGVFYARIEYAGGRIYSTNGVVIDPARRVRVGEFAAVGATVLPDVELGRACFLDSGTVSAYDLNTFQLLGSVFVDATAGRAPRCLRNRSVATFATRATHDATTLRRPR